MIDFTLAATAAASPEETFAVLTDHRRYKDVTVLRRSTLEREGVPAPNGVGAIRRVGLVGPTQTEEITLYRAPTEFAYELRSGLPVKHHRATVTLSEVPAGTQITYRVQAKPSIPGAGVVLGPLMKFGVRAVLRGLIRAAEHSAETSAQRASPGAV